MPDSGYFIHQLDISNYSSLVPLMKDCFGMEVDEGYFKWKYFENPAGHCVGFLAIERKTNTTVAFYGAIPQKYLVDSKEIIIYQACDTMTHTQHRKKSLFPVLAQECYRYLQDQNNFRMISIGGTALTFSVLKLLGWKPVFNFRTYFKPIYFCWFYFLKRYSADSFVAEPEFDAVERVLLSQPQAAKIRSPKDPMHYKWRVNNPRYTYQIVAYSNRNTIKGFVVYYILNNKVFLFDLIGADASAEKALLWYLSKIVVTNKYRGILAFCQENGNQSFRLKRKLFLTNPFNRGPLSVRSPLFVNGYDSEITKFLNPDIWDLSAYDYDAS